MHSGHLETYLYLTPMHVPWYNFLHRLQNVSYYQAGGIFKTDFN